MPEQQNKANLSYPCMGLNVDSVSHQQQATYTTFALNGVLETTDGNSYTYQNEEGNEFCVDLPANYRVIGAHVLIPVNKTILFLSNPDTGDSIIGVAEGKSCVFNALIDDTFLNSDKLGFSVHRPIREVVLKVNNCDVQVYWADNVARRYLDLGDLPWKEIPDPTNEYKNLS